MPRLPRIYIENVLYYVTARGGHNQMAFIDSPDYQEYLSLLSDYKKQYGFNLYAYALLPTHLHLLLEVKNNIATSMIMHDINSRYTKLHNSRYRKKGHLFEARFRSVIAEKDKYLLALIRHIHLNPQRIGVTNDFQNYPYSSYASFLDPSKRGHPEMQAEITESLAYLKGREEEFRLYSCGYNENEIQQLHAELRKKRIIGSKEFIQGIKAVIEHEQLKQKRRRLLQKRIRLIAVAAAAVIVVSVSLTVDYFQRRATSLKSEYEKTLTRYQATLNILTKERDRALKAEQDIQGYQWKIELVEKALEDLEKQRQVALNEQMAIEGYQWNIKLNKIGGDALQFNPTDTLVITSTHVSSAQFTREGFAPSRYSKRAQANGMVVWETLQVNKAGDRVSWRGEWDGKIMKGYLRKSQALGGISDFSFESSGERQKI
ncbi:MAG: transposase [Candidatus Omnitrophota bacterium]